jgi:hypothetical protein
MVHTISKANSESRQSEEEKNLGRHKTLFLEQIKNEERRSTVQLLESPFKNCEVLL